MSKSLRNPLHNSPENSMFSLLTLVDAINSGNSISEASAIAGCSEDTAVKVSGSDAFKMLLARRGALARG